MVANCTIQYPVDIFALWLTICSHVKLMWKPGWRKTIYNWTMKKLKHCSLILKAQRTEYKSSSMCYDIVSEAAPPYLSDWLHLYIPSRSMRSSADTRTFWIPKQKKNFQGLRTFSHLGPVTWNILPYYVRYAATKSQFKTQLKTTLFLSAHGPDS